MKSFNINNYATVTLTAFGAEVYNIYYADLKDRFPNEYWPVNVQAGYVHQDQVWSLFEVFGKHMGIGMVNPFKECIMMFDEKDFQDE